MAILSQLFSALDMRVLFSTQFLSGLKDLNTAIIKEIIYSQLAID